MHFNEIDIVMRCAGFYYYFFLRGFDIFFHSSLQNGFMYGYTTAIFSSYSKCISINRSARLYALEQVRSGLVRGVKSNHLAAIFGSLGPAIGTDMSARPAI